MIVGYEVERSVVRFFTFEQFHNKGNIGSTRLRVHQLIKYWPEAGIYKYGDNPDVLVFQKVYLAPDYSFPKLFEGIKILDICDPDWLDNMPVAQTLEAMDGVTCPTEPLAEYLRQITDKPVLVIPDRHDMEQVPELKIHTGRAKRIVWFGYKQNAELLQFAMPTIEVLGLELTLIANEDPFAYRWANDPESYREHYHYGAFDKDKLFDQLREHDICVLPSGNRPVDRFKSNNKTTLAWLAGLPVASTGDELRLFLEPEARNEYMAEYYPLARRDFDCILSVNEMKGFIDDLQASRR